MNVQVKPLPMYLEGWGGAFTGNSNHSVGIMPCFYIRLFNVFHFKYDFNLIALGAQSEARKYINAAMKTNLALESRSGGGFCTEIRRNIFPRTENYFSIQIMGSKIPR